VYTTFTILSASISTTVNGTSGTTETSDYTLYVGDNSKSFTNTLSHNVRFSSFVEEVNLGKELNSKIYMGWRTPISWTTTPSQVAHNVVLYCTRNFDPIT
jgi:hypothetical protein